MVSNEMEREPDPIQQRLWPRASFDMSTRTYRPRAWIIADFSKDGKAREQFELSRGPNELYRELVGGDLSFVGLTEADRFVKNATVHFQPDPIGGEDFHTVFETRMPKVGHGASVSLHRMLLGARESQRLHYHPPSGVPADPTTSIRQVLLYPLLNMDTGEGGVTFEWFQLANSGTQRDDRAAFARATGTPIGKRHVVRAEPGQVVLLEFGQGVHHFAGLGFALSAHFHDRETGNPHGSFLGNTATWAEREDEPTDILEVDIINGRGVVEGKSGLSEKFNTLSSLVAYHHEILKRRLLQHAQRMDGTGPFSLHHSTRTAMIRELRAD